MKATKLLRSDHAAVKALFARFTTAGERARVTRRRLIDRLAMELTIHAAIEEEIFYPAMAKVPAAARLVKEARSEHNDVKDLIVQIRGLDPVADEATTLVRDLKNAVLHHASEEEKVMFPMAEQKIPAEELERLGEELKARKLSIRPAEIRRMLRKAA
jgi:iron-sulfur cluster repair protein YtfE (RIC family)